jgi:hypothetical protein
MSPPEPLTIRALVLEASGLDADAFAERIGMGALIGSLPAANDDWAYHTNLRRAFSPALPGIELASSIVFPLLKRHSTFKDTILIGRALSNDICLAHSSVSKLHARTRSIDGRVHIADAGSSNGTEVDGERIVSEVALAQGSTIDLGDCSFVFYEPRALHAALIELRRTSTL